jgi:oligopeptide/dipeptide ABC transporter ATP-binding protein
MYLGKVVELADRRDLFRKQEHPYTEALMSAIPVPNPELRRQRIILKGDVPSPLRPPSGCRFHPRCHLRASLGNPEICAAEEPPLIDAGNEHFVACHFRGANAQPGGATAGS